jgi:peptidoglycan/LPS O-acetylase OafA/YrhL
VLRSIGGRLEQQAPGEAGPVGGSKFDSAPRSRLRTDIEGLRAIAVIAVILYHAEVPGVSGGFAGVDVFFVISGYLITNRLVWEAGSGSGVAFRDFYARRVRRILPMANLVIIITIAIAVMTESRLQLAQSMGPDARAAALFFSNVRFAANGTTYLGEAGSVSPFLQFWSLSVEEQFYLLWPALMMLVAAVAARAAKPVRALAAVALGIVVAVSFSLSLHFSAARPIDAFFVLQYRAWELGVGALVAVCASELMRLTRPINGALGIVGLVAVAASVFLYGAETVWPGWAATVPVLGTAMVITAGLAGPVGLVNRCLALWPVQAAGRYSYSLYLWHWPLIVAVDGGGMRSSVAAAVALTVVLSVVSFHLVEHPVRSSTWLRERTNVSLAMGLALVLIAAAASFVPALVAGPLDSGRPYDGPPHQPGSPPVPTDFVPSNLTTRLADSTNDRDPYAERNVSCRKVGQCAYGDAAAQVQVVLFGDSHAGHWTPALEALASEKGWHVERLTRGECNSFARPEGAEGNSLGTNRACRRWLDRTWREIERLKPDLLILSNVSRPKKTDDFESLVRQAIERAPEETRVAVFSQDPLSGTDVPECLSDHLEDTAKCDPTRSPDWPASIDAVLSAVAAESGATFVDLTPMLCTSDRCPTIAENILVYRGGSHLTSAFARSRAPDLGLLLDPILR